MSEPQVRRFPFLLTISVLTNLVLLGLIAGVLYKARPEPPPPAGERPGFELSREDRDAVRQLMRASFEAGRESLEARHAAERHLVEVLSAEPYDEAAARVALAELREADEASRDIVARHMLDGMGDLSSEQRGLVARLMAGNLERRGGHRGKLEKLRERREERERELEDREP
jgi:uncharacterized membrane protein